MEKPVEFNSDLLPLQPLYRPRGQSVLPPLRLVVGLTAVSLLVYGLAAHYLLWTGWDILQAMFIAVVLFAVLLAVSRARRINALWLEVNDTPRLINSGRTAEAAEKLDDLCARTRPWPFIHALAVNNRAVVFLHEGRVDRARSLFGAALHSGWFGREKHPLYRLYPLLLGHLALCAAIEGRLDEAEQWQQAAHEHLAPEAAGLLLLEDVAIGLRRDRGEVVLKDAETDWLNAEGSLSPLAMRTLRVLCAFALTFGPSEPDRPARLQRLLEGARPSRAGEFDYLALQWPAFKAFLEANGFCRAAAVSAHAPGSAKVVKNG